MREKGVLNWISVIRLSIKEIGWRHNNCEKVLFSDLIHILLKADD